MKIVCTINNQSKKYSRYMELRRIYKKFIYVTPSVIIVELLSFSDNPVSKLINFLHSREPSRYHGRVKYLYSVLIYRVSWLMVFE